MRIGILKTGHPPADLEAVVGSYPAMIRTALGPAYTYREFDAANGGLPGPDSTADAYVLTGSASSAYDREPWIARLRGWLQALDPAVPLVGICFGHQIMADAYGGVVEKSDKGLAVGLHEYTVSDRQGWMDDGNSVVLPVAHYDQVVRAPAASRVVATSDFCRYAALSYSDRRAISFQAHPEFTLEYAGMLIDRFHHNGKIGAAPADRAKASLRRPDDRARVIGWIRRFLTEADTAPNLARGSDTCGMPRAR